MEASLHAWEQQRKTASASSSSNKRAQESNLASAIELREQGNARFRAGDFERAHELYTSSLNCEETIESLTNRALVCIKLTDFTGAISDCNRALALDKCNVKAFARRGTARSALGEHEAALVDFRAAELLEPANKALRREREREEALLQATMALPPYSSAQDEEEEEEEAQPPPPRAVAPVIMANPVLSQTLAALEQSVSLPAQVPRTRFGFENLWRELKGRQALRNELVAKRMTCEDFARCFGETIEPDVMEELLLCIEQEEDLARIVRDCLAPLPSFDMLKLMLPNQVKQELERRCGGGGKLF